MTTIKETNARPAAANPVSPVSPSRRIAQALEFHRETTQARRMYDTARLEVESERAEKIRSLKAAIKNGTYAPNLTIVAERMLGDLKRA